MNTEQISNDLQKAYEAFKQQSSEDQAITTSKIKEMRMGYEEEIEKLKNKLSNDDNYKNNVSVGMEFLKQSKGKFEHKLTTAKEKLNGAMDEAKSLEKYLSKTEEDLELTTELETVYVNSEAEINSKLNRIDEGASPLQQKLVNVLLQENQNSLISIRETKYFLEIERKTTLNDIALNEKTIDELNTEIEKIKNDLNSVDNKIADDRLDKNEKISDEKQLQKLISVVEYLKLREAFTSVDNFEKISNLMEGKQDVIENVAKHEDNTPDIEALISALQQEDSSIEEETVEEEAPVEAEEKLPSEEVPFGVEEVETEELPEE